VKTELYKTILLSVVLYVCKTLSLTLREEHTLRVFEKRVVRGIFGPKAEKVAGGCRQLHNGELRNLHNIRAMKSCWVRWVRQVTRMGETKKCMKGSDHLGDLHVDGRIILK
jgi:hypothetical protein